MIIPTPRPTRKSRRSSKKFRAPVLETSRDFSSRSSVGSFVAAVRVLDGIQRLPLPNVRPGRSVTPGGVLAPGDPIRRGLPPWPSPAPWPGLPTWSGLLAARGRGNRHGGRSDETAESRRRRAAVEELNPAEALTMLVRDHSEAAYRVAFSVTRDPHLAEDVAQDALLKAWQALPTYRGDAPLRNWLLRITHNTAISAMRRRRDTQMDPGDLPEPAAGRDPSAPAGVEDHVVDRAAVEEFTAALDRLDELSRSIVVLRELEGLSYDAIADLLEISLPTVKTRLLRARRVLADALEGWRP